MGLYQTRARKLLFLRGFHMAIFSLNHKHVGKVGQKHPYTAAAHVRYITRSKACSQVMAERMPEDTKQAQKWFCNQEDVDRKNARICDKVMLALPKELTATQQHELVREFAENITKGRAAWFADFHDKDKDQNNPHCHLVIRDRDFETFKRVAELSEKGSTERLREQWETLANKALQKAGSKERIDRRTLKEQGIDRKPQIHEGVRARKMLEAGKTPESKILKFRNAVTAKQPERAIDYQKIDNGKTRAEHNAQIINLAQKRKEKGLEQSYSERHIAIGQAINEVRAVRKKLDQEADLERAAQKLLDELEDETEHQKSKDKGKDDWRF
ncbi:MAG: conjugal transfer protein TraA [Marinovum sp.]|nr:conjugal transfer protein TraA [Marinovum sp.]